MKVKISFLLLSGIFLLITGCSQDGLSPMNDEQTQELNIKDFESKRPVRDADLSTDLRLTELSDDVISLPAGAYPQSTSCTATFFKNWGQYKGAICRLENGSCFEFYNGALTPPASIPWGEEVLITMQVEKDQTTGALIYSFGPSGCQFEPAALLWLDYSDLGTENATLYYLDADGNRIEHLPDNIDFYNKRMCIYVDHFSRYAVAYSD